MVTNDDGIDSTGLHVLARRLTSLGDVVIVAPDTEYSGFGGALGTLHLVQPEVHQSEVEGIAESWAVTGPPGLCVYFARLGAFGDFDLVVSGINPGVNTGRAIYHSGTVGAVLKAVGTLPPRAIAEVRLVPKIGHDRAYCVELEWGDPIELPAETDGGTVERDYVSVTNLSRFQHDDRPDLRSLDTALDRLFT